VAVTEAGVSEQLVDPQGVVQDGPHKDDARQTVAVVIPAYQAAPSVGHVVRGCLSLMPEVLVIDDGSDDATAEAARQAGAEVISLPVNRGKGNALRTAFGELFGRGFSAVVTVDADGQHLPEEIPVLIRAAEGGADLVMGTRDHLFREMSKVRQLSNRLSSRAISLLAGRALGDVQTGFRLYSKRLVESVGFPEARFEAESAVVVRAARRGFKIASVPVKLGFADGRTTSHYRPLRDSLRIAAAVIHARFEG
jgi:glycosyltransferase involved in cell wall biosynthesis